MSGYGTSCDSCYGQLDIENNALNEDGTPHVCKCFGGYMANRHDIEHIDQEACLYRYVEPTCAPRALCDSAELACSKGSSR